MMRFSSPLLLAALLAFALPAAAAKPVAKSPPAAPVVAPPIPPIQTPGPLNQVAQAAMGGGVQKCANRISVVTSFLSGSGPAGTVLFVAPTNQDKSIVSASMETSSPDLPLAYSSATFAPGAAPAACSAEYEQITYWTAVCGEVAAKVFTTFKLVGALRQHIQVMEGGRDVRIFLIPAGPGCVAIKKEVVY